MALVQVRDDRIRQWAGVFRRIDVFRVDRFFADQDGDAGALRIVVLARDIQNIGADDRAGFAQDLGQPVGIILFVNVGDIAVAIVCGLGVTNIVNTKLRLLVRLLKPCSFSLCNLGHLLYLLA